MEENVARTDEMFKSLIAVVDRYLSRDGSISLCSTRNPTTLKANAAKQ
jgi:hypothetical protein